MLKSQALDRLYNTLSSLEGRAKIEPIGLTQESRQKLVYLEASGRPFLKDTQALRQAAARFGKAALAVLLSKRKAVTRQDLFAGIGEGIKQQVMLRFNNNGNDVELKPLSLDYIKQKRLHGLSGAIGIATEKLKRELSQVFWGTKES